MLLSSAIGQGIIMEARRHRLSGIESQRGRISALPYLSLPMIIVQLFGALYAESYTEKLCWSPFRDIKYQLHLIFWRFSVLVESNGF